MAGKSVKKHGVTTRQLVDEVPEGCSLPDFEQKPVTMALAEGRNAILRAVVCGEPLPQVRWQSSQGDLSNSSKYQLLSAPGSREHALQVNKLTGEDTDKYYCVAVNPYGEAVCSARLTVIEVGFRKKRKRNTEPQEDLSKELMDLRRMLRKSAPPPKKKMDPEQVWQLLMSADRKDYERLCIQYGIADFRGMLRKLEKMRRERDDRMAQYVNAVSNTKQMRVTKEGVAFFELDLDLKDPESNVYLYKDGEMVPYSSESHAKRSVRRLGKHYHFQIQDLWPEDAGLYQVKVEDAEVFSTELEASAIPPRVVVPLSEARCEERGDAVFACTLSNPCPHAAWHFKHQPLQLSDKYEASVSPDGLTHQLVVRGARLSDMGPYSLDTGLHVSSAWLVVETGQDQGPLTTSADHQAQGQGAPASDTEGSRRASGERGVPRERGGAPGGAGRDPGRQLPAGLDGGGLGGHSYSSMGGEGAGGAAWGPGQAGKGFPEADRFAATVSGDDQLHGEGGWDTSLPGGPQSQGEGAGSGLGLTGGHELDGDGGGGPVGGWGAGGLGGRGAGQEDSGDSRGQLWGAQLGPGTGKGALQGSQSGPAGSGAGGEGMEGFLQEESPGGVRGEDALSRERGSGAAWGAGGSGAGLGVSGDGSVAGGPGALGSPGSEAGRGPGSWGSGGRGDEDPGDARGLGGPGLSPGQTPAGQGSQGPAIPGGRDPHRGHGGPEGSRQEGGPGGPGGWGGEGQGPGPWGDMGSSLSQAGAHPGPGGGRGGVGGTQAPGLMGSGQGSDGSSHGLIGAPGRGAQGPWGPQGDAEGAGGPGAAGSGPDFWNGARNAGEGGPRGERGAEAGLVGSRYGEGSGYFRGTGPESGAGSGDGSRAPGEVGSAWGVGAPGGAEAEEGGAYRGGSRGPGAVRPGDQDGQGPAGRGPGTPAGLRSGSGGPGGGGGEEAGVRPETWGATSGGPGEAGPGGRRRPSGGLGTSTTVGAGGEGHVGAEPGAKGAPGGGWADGSGGPGATEPGSLRAGGGGGGGGGGEGTWGLGWDESGRPKAQGPDRGHRDGPGILGPQHHGGGGSGGPGSGGVGPGGEAGFRAGSGGLGGMGSGSEAGHRDGLGAPGGVGSGAQAGYKDRIGGVGGMGSGAQAGYRDGIGGVAGMGSGSEPGYNDGLGAPGGVGSGAQAGYRDGIGGVGGMGSGTQEGYRDGIGGVGGMGSGSEPGYRDGLGAPGGVGLGAQAGPKDGFGGPGGVGSGAQAGPKDGFGGPGGVGSGAQAGPKDGFGGPGGVGSGAQAGLKDGFGGPGGVGSGAQAGPKDGFGGPGGVGSGAQAGLKDGFGGPGGVGSGAQAGPKDGFGGPGGVGSGAQAGLKDGFGGPGGVGSGAQAGPKDGFGGPGGVGSGLAAGHRGGPGGSGEAGPESEWGSGGGPGRPGAAGALASAGQEGGPKGREAGGPGAGSGVGSGVASEGPYGGPSSEGGRGPGLVNGAGPGVGSGLPGAVSAGGSASSGAPGAPGDREAPSGKGGSAGQAGGVGAPGCLDGPGAMEGEAWAGAGAGALGSRREKGSGNAGAGAGTADRGGAAAQGGPGPQGAGDSLLGGGGVAAASGTGTGEAQDGGRGPRHRGKSALASAEGPGVSRARAPGRGDQGFEGGRAGAGSQPPGSGVDDVAFGGTQEGPEGSRGRAGAAGPGEAGGRQGPGVRDSRGSGPESRRPAGPRDVDGAWSGLEGPLGSKDSGDRPTDVGGPGAPPGRGRRGGRGPLGAEDDKAPTEDEAPRGSRSRTRVGATVGATERRAQEEAGGRGPRPGAEDGAEDTGSSGEAPCENGSRAGSRRAGTEGRPGGGGRGQDAPRSPRGRHKIGTGCFCEEGRAPQGHFSRELADTEARLGEAATLSCTLSRDLGPGAWFKDGVQLSTQDGLVFEQEGLVRRLLIAHAQGTHAGRYSFVAGDQKSEATLTVRDPPVIAPDVTERLQEPLVVKAGKPLSVKIAFESRLPVQAAWTKDGAAVDGAGGRGAQVALGDGFARLCLPSASRRDGGQYSVTLRSQGGSVQAGLTLHVIDKPQPPQGPLEVEDCRGAGVCLRWRPPRDDGGRALEHYVVERRQAGRSTWLKVGQPPADATSFTDAQVEQGRKYAFRVRAVTSEGPGEALELEEVLVAPEARPGPPSAPAILSASSQSITLSWTAPRGPGSAHILGYLVDKRKKGSNTWAAVTEQPVPERKWTVMDLRPDCQYEFRVTAVAPSGPGQPGPPSDPVFARDPMRPPGPVRDLQVTDTSHTSISLRWAPPDTQDADEAQGYVVELCPSDSLEWAPCHAGTVPGTTFTAKGLRPREGYFVRVVAVNDGGRGQPAALDVVVQAMPAQVSPRFLVDSSTTDTLVVRVGDTIRVPVRFEAAPLPEVTWLKDGLPLSQRSVTSTKDGLTQLLVPVAGLSDSGLYCVVLRGPQGQEATHTFALRVAARPQAPGPVHLQENVPGTVTAEWEPSPDEARGVPLHYTVLMRSAAHGPWREVADRVHTTRFTFPGVVPGHEYHFRVVAKNELGASEPSDASQPWCLPRLRDKVPVKPASYREPDRSQKPWFLVGLRSHLLPAGCECCMSCAVRGCPPPRVTWFKNGESLEGRRGAYSTDTLGVCSLVIPGVGPEDSGLYKAVAENALGQAVSTATLLVTDPSS